jgi:hypothetical protein
MKMSKDNVSWFVNVEVSGVAIVFEYAERTRWALGVDNEWLRHSLTDVMQFNGMT